MEDFKAKAKEIEALEAELQFDQFYSDDALKIGLALIEESKKRNGNICIDITVAGRRLFYFAGDGKSKSNDTMIERKKNTTMHTNRSSLWAYYTLKDIGLTIEQKWNVDPSQYVAVGGAFPIRLVNCSAIIGTITVSGFDHTVDHGIIIDVLKAGNFCHGGR